MSKHSIRRRDFVKRCVVGIGGLVMLQRCAFDPNYWKFLTRKEGELLEAIAEQFIPADDDPGAQEACVVNFIDTQLTKHYIRFQQNYRQGLRAFQNTCKETNGKKYELLSSEEQIAFLESVESGDVPEKHWDFQKPTSFFRLMLSHCMQGFYGDPRHGGNCNHVSYQMIDLPVIQFYQPETSELS
jgi:gluconate 2-dehydrogenase gamma chain